MMSQIVQDVTCADQFEEELQLSMTERGIVVADVYSDDWGPCYAIHPTFKRLYLETDESIKIKFLTVNATHLIDDVRGVHPDKERWRRTFPRPKNHQQIKDTLPDYWLPLMEDMVISPKPKFIIWHQWKMVFTTVGVKTPEIVTAITDLTAVQTPAAEYITNAQLLEQWCDVFGAEFSDIRWTKFVEGLTIMCKLTVPLTVDEENSLRTALQVKQNRVLAADVQEWVGANKTVLQSFTELLPNYEQRAIEVRLQQEAEERKRVNAGLLVASAAGDFRLAQSLVERGADVNHIGTLADPPVGLHLPIGQSRPLHWAVGGGHQRVAELLLEKGVDVASVDETGRQPLHYAPTKELATLLLLRGATVDARDHQGCTPLHYASEFSGNRLPVVKTLLAEGADPRVGASNGITPLHLAIEADGALEAAQALLGHGAEINARGVRDRTRVNVTPLHTACDTLARSPQQLAIVQHLASQPGVELDAQDDRGNTPLHIAAQWRYVELVELLVSYGANIRVQNNAHQEPRDLTQHVSIRRLLQPQWFEEMVQSIRVRDMLTFESLLSKKEVDIDYADWQGFTILMASCLYNDAAVVRDLLKRGASSSLRERHGFSATFFAHVGGAMDIISQGFDQPQGDDNIGLENLRNVIAKASKTEHQFLSWSSKEGEYRNIKFDSQRRQKRVVRPWTDIPGAGMKPRMEAGVSDLVSELVELWPQDYHPPDFFDWLTTDLDVPAKDAIVLDCRFFVLLLQASGCIFSTTATAVIYLYTYECDIFQQVHKSIAQRESDATVLDKWRPFVFHLYAALDQLPHAPGMVYRGISRPMFDLAPFTPGAELAWPAFVSASRSLAIASSWMIVQRQQQAESNEKCIQIVFRIQGRNHRSVFEFSHFPSEAEVIFPPSAKFTVIGYGEPQGGQWPLASDEAGGNAIPMRQITFEELDSCQSIVIDLQEVVGQ
eukprot:TRINITY_DN67186_c9_g2_i2.p1 TRINITY_DN67186_c9_g2~~TRINITY_DN67186_c9_g2_i2.p1  ORF type:complete len:948 (+),score=106.86 TRINITY_DN67186_c9_g2_i2:60-2903(+)